MTKKKPRFGALPKLNMPEKSHETTKPTPRPGRSVVKDCKQPSSSSVYYKTYINKLCQRVKGLKTINDWNHKLFADRLVLRKHVEHFPDFLLPELEIIIDESLCFTVKVFGSFLVEDHDLYMRYRRTMRNVTVSVLVKELKACKLCGGVNASEMTSKLYHHVIPLTQDLVVDEDSEQFPHEGCWRAKGCLLLCEQDSVCVTCTEYLVSTRSSSNARERRQLKPGHVKAPVSKTDPERIKLTLQGQRLQCAELERELNEMRGELVKTNIEVDHELSNDFS